jgi:uncharacterized tellurite resistance protein B-like protein
MLNSLRDFFGMAPVPGTEADTHRLQQATAALLFEVLRSDHEIGDEERAAAGRALREHFGLDATAAEDLIALAAREVPQANDHFQFTSLLNRHFSQPDKERVIELMWQVAYADGRLSAHELHLMRKIAGLLHIAEPAYIAAKLRARDASGGDQP